MSDTEEEKRAVLTYVQDLFRRAGVSQVDWAREAEVHTVAVSRWLSPKKLMPPNGKNLVKLARATERLEARRPATSEEEDGVGLAPEVQSATLATLQATLEKMVEAVSALEARQAKVEQRLAELAPPQKRKASGTPPATRVRKAASQ